MGSLLFSQTCLGLSFTREAARRFASVCTQVHHVTKQYELVAALAASRRPTYTDCFKSTLSKFRKRSELASTDKLDSDMAALASTGESTKPVAP